MNDVPRPHRRDADGQSLLWPARSLASLPANAARSEYAARRARPEAAIGEAMTTCLDVEADDLGPEGPQDDGAQVLEPVNAGNVCSSGIGVWQICQSLTPDD